jgi:hypothetical protein
MQQHLEVVRQVHACLYVPHVCPPYMGDSCWHIGHISLAKLYPLDCTVQLSCKPNIARDEYDYLLLV